MEKAAQTYIDIHCHILPGVDDGSDSMETSLEMLRCSEAQGANALILTPHYYHGHNPYRAEELKQRAELLGKAAKEQGLSIKLYTGNEILWFESALSAIRTGEALTLANSRYVLIEFYPDASYSLILKAVRELIRAGYTPVIAHFERYHAFYGNNGAQNVSEIRDQGALLQMNYDSLSGGAFLGNLFADAHTAWCRKQVQSGNVSFFGTDAHNLGRRPVEHTKAAAWLRKHVEPKLLSELLFENPKRILKSGTD